MGNPGTPRLEQPTITPMVPGTSRYGPRIGMLLVDEPRVGDGSHRSTPHGTPPAIARPVSSRGSSSTEAGLWMAR